MVGDPKYLSDLARIEADVRMRCRKCGLEEDWSIESLRRHLSATGGSEVWSEVGRGISCRRSGCDGRDMRVIPLPFTRKPPNLPGRVRPRDGVLVDLALRVLEDAAPRGQDGPIGTSEVRLALYVLDPYLRDTKLVRECWREACRENRTQAGAMHQFIRWIEFRLVQRGWILPRPDLKNLTLAQQREFRPGG